MAQYFKGGSNENFPSDNFLPEVYSKKVLNFFRKASVVEAITNTDYEGEISSFGDSVKIIDEPLITISDYNRGEDVSATTLTDTAQVLIVDKAKAFKFIVDDIEANMSHVNWKEVAASSAAYALKDAYDKAVLDVMLANVSGSAPDNIIGSENVTPATGLGSATGGLALGTNLDPLDVMARLARLLDDQNVPEEGRFFVAPPSFYEALSQSESKLLSVDYNAGSGSIRNGLVSSGKLRGFEMYKSNNIVADTNTYEVLAGSVSATATAQTIVNTEVLRSPTTFGDICRGLHVFGSKVVRPNSLAKAHIAN
mgnify:CR=1 FL=1|tara:strand:+ start:1796 stop:2725 length:930 start_codon:yes stop_codon:yes gene_type:complete